MDDHTPHPVDIHVGRMIRARRKQLRVPQAALGDALGVSFQQIQKYERAANRVSCSALVAIAKRLDCAPADLLPPVEVARDSAGIDTCLDLAGAPHGLEVAQAYLAMDPLRQKGLLGVVRALTAQPAPTTIVADPDQIALFDDGAEAGLAYVAGSDFQERPRHVA